MIIIIITITFSQSYGVFALNVFTSRSFLNNKNVLLHKITDQANYYYFLRIIIIMLFWPLLLFMSC